MSRRWFAMIRLTLLEGIRSRFLWLTLAALGVGVVLAGFGGTLAVIQVQAIESGLLGSWLRLAGVLLITLFVLNSLARELQDKGLELLLALPASRGDYLLGKLLGFAVVAGLIVVLFAGPLLLLAPVEQVVLWGISLFFEQWILIALSLLCLLNFQQVPTAFGVVFLIYLFSRSVATLQLVAHGPILSDHSIFMDCMQYTMDFFSYVLPGLHRFTRSEWLMYANGGWDDLGFVVGQGVIYVFFLFGVALIDFNRKNI